jgi:RNA polymerase sigma-70 factor, ECF subfamily
MTDSRIALLEQNATLLENNVNLADRFAQNDRSAFDRLVDRYQSMVYTICFRLLQHRQDAEDASQETFTRLARYLQRWDRTRPLEPYLKTIAENRCRSAMARRRPTQSLSIVDEPQTNAHTLYQSEESLREEVVRVLETLPQAHRQAFELFHQRSMSYAQIATVMKCPVGTVKTWVHRARCELIQQMQNRGVINDSRAKEVES